MYSCLSDDCVLAMCDNLDVTDHIAMANTSKRLACIVQQHYRTASLETTDGFWRYSEEHQVEFNRFWSLINVDLKKLILQPKEPRHIELMRSWEFKNLRHLSFSPASNLEMPLDSLMRLVQPNSMNLELLALEGIDWKQFQMLLAVRLPRLTHLELICKNNLLRDHGEFKAEMLPALKTLILDSVTTFEGIWNLTNLTELKLLQCHRILPQQVEKILLKCPLKKLTVSCKFDFRAPGQCEDVELKKYYKAIAQRHDTIEELFLDYHYVHMFTSELPQLMKLRKLTFLSSSCCLCDCREKKILPETLFNHNPQLGELCESY